MNKELLQKAEDFAKKRLFAFMSQREVANPYAFKLGFDAGAKEILDNPELYELVKGSKYEDLERILSNNEKVVDAANRIIERLKQENKELKEEIERLTKICNGCFETIHNKSVEIEKLKAGKLNKSNY